MRIYEIIFSPTGGTEKVADIIATAFDEERMVIDLSNQDFTVFTQGINMLDYYVY